MHSRSMVYLGLIVSSVIWGFNFGISRLIMESLHPATLAFLRFAGAVPLFFIVLKLKEGSVLVGWKDMIKLLFLGLFGVAVLEIGVLYSIQLTTLANASLLNVGPWPIFTMLLAPLFTNEKITARLMIGGGLAFIGVVLIILGGGQGLDFGSEHLWGDLISLAISLLGALFNLACMPLMKRYSALRVSTWYILFGVLFMFPFTWGTWTAIDWAALDAVKWIAIFYNIVPATFFAFFVWNYGMLKAGASRANFFRYAVPATAVAAGYLMYGEVVKGWQIAGGVLIAAGLVWVTLEKTGKAAPEQAIVQKQA
ncbi:DMT family transporter [Paenibacillus sp. MSJ-34]|uniref:DMT family transporter n=1 Tax=Paenibacillus sp. MSJ-34 TaxID=2841529 RepID=UPI001C110443|nr:DMT family transporter [Paenibacillus sp. MSJ-34]MBU5443422.1 DMT family transporter [Paenibacillus sp. MSJ-34]